MEKKEKTVQLCLCQKFSNDHSLCGKSAFIGSSVYFGAAASNELIWMCIFGVGARQLGVAAISDTEGGLVIKALQWRGYHCRL